MEYIAIVRTQFVSFHCWPEAPEEVSFLRHRHRHVMHVELSVAEYHSDRDVELTLLRAWLDEWLSKWSGADLGAMSVEMMGEQIIEAALERGYLPISVKVMEDGENGAEVMP